MAKKKRRSPKTWKNVERVAARKFGAERNIGSGSLGREDRSHSDSTHETIYIETKYGQANRFFTKEMRDILTKDVQKAKDENKTFVACIKIKGMSGFWVITHVDDLDKIISEYTKNLEFNTNE